MLFLHKNIMKKEIFWHKKKHCPTGALLLFLISLADTTQKRAVTV